MREIVREEEDGEEGFLAHFSFPCKKKQSTSIYTYYDDNHY